MSRRARDGSATAPMALDSRKRKDVMNFAKLNSRLGGAGGRTLAALAIVGAVLAGCSKSLPDDGKDAKMMRFNNLNNYRYCEVFLIGGNPITKDLSAVFYNTTDLNNATNPRDSCPEDMWAKVDADALKKQYDVLGVFKNGPRYWMYDWAELPVGTQHDFGVQARWFGRVELPKDFGKAGSTFYKPTTVHRNSKQGYAKGQTVFILDDPDGTPWVMQASSRLVDPNLTYDDLRTLDKKLKLPPGWKYRVKVLDQDLGLGVINGLAHVTQDDLENTYNACFEADNKKNCTYKP
jgi:hypothetical protein